VGRIVEIAPSQALCSQPLHPYTKALFAAALPAHPDEKRDEGVITGEVPSALHPLTGCHFHPRCPYAEPRCAQEAPALKTVAPQHVVACHLV
jgi:peptide/nickel transport system ATP-binding protein